MTRIVTLVLALVGLGCSPQGSQVERSVAKNKLEMESYLNAHILSSYSFDGKVAFVTDGKLGVYNSDQKWGNEFTLQIGGQIQTQADHHILTVFELKRVERSLLVLNYLSTFDHISFGKNLISIDEGEVEVPLKGKQ